MNESTVCRARARRPRPPSPVAAQQRRRLNDDGVPRLQPERQGLEHHRRTGKRPQRHPDPPLRPHRQRGRRGEHQRERDVAVDGPRRPSLRQRLGRDDPPSGPKGCRIPAPRSTDAAPARGRPQPPSARRSRSPPFLPARRSARPAAPSTGRSRSRSGTPSPPPEDAAHQRRRRGDLMAVDHRAIGIAPQHTVA